MSRNLGNDRRQVIFCDMCTEDNRKPAQKTCMKCEISMCVQHLQAHLTTPVLLQTHTLTEPIASGNGGLVVTTKCPQHGKLLEYYCLDDLTFVCVSCAIEDQHSKHNMKTFSTAHKELLEKVQAEQQALLVKADGANTSLEKWEKNEREKLGRSSVRLIEAVTNLRDLALTRVQSSVSARMVSIKTSKSSLQAAKSEEDAFRFLQMYSQVNQDLKKAKVVNLKKGVESGSDRDTLVEEITQRGEKMMEQVSNFWGSLLTHVDPENQQELSAVSSDPFFDPLTYGPGISLSKDKRKVFYNDWQGEPTPFAFLIQGTQSSRDCNIYRWVISLSNDCDWTIGLCDQNYAQQLNQRDGEVYGLHWKDNQLSSLITHYDTYTSDTTTVYSNKKARSRTYSQVLYPSGEDKTKQMAQYTKVEVVRSYPNLSFFSVIGQHQKRQIVNITVSSNGHLTSFVCFEMENSKNSSIKSSASGSGVSSTHQQLWQKQWKCSCGRVYPWKIDPNIHYLHQMSPRNNCDCGKNIGLDNTEVLCELL
ncbi:tripartite motif-containing protein 16-like [Labrus mixtus]|uniref:tripartite motif-containing protein 16-like n=1 Tax=Labrus mixtus TaxID=508554 RepID=UPI0029C03B68|nr:tripartite motif-containing protein 16-like [Labrus mixtus]